MTKNPAKDFGPIAEDYAFFEQHSSEAERDAQAYWNQLTRCVPSTGAIRMLDFGCGSGTFTERLLNRISWPPERLELTLLEPVEAARRQAVSRLAGFAQRPARELRTLPADLAEMFDVIIANHVFYYVTDLKEQLKKLIAALTPSGLFLTAIAAQSNALIEFWVVGFGLLNREIPYNTSEDVEAALQHLGAHYQKQQIAYELSFSDTEENRMRIIRFLLADHLAQIPVRPLVELFDKYSQGGRIFISTASEHFTIR